jgi:hypothetical protein
MKKITLLFVFALASIVVSAQCVIDQNNTQYLNPDVNNLPCIEVGVPYEEVIQIYIPSSIQGNQVDSVVITSIDGLPLGITYELNPANGVIPGGGNACVTLEGTTNAATGRYDLTLQGTAYVKLFGVPQTIALNQISTFVPDFQLAVDVILPGEPCRGVVSVSDITANLSIAMYPNPNNGIFTLSVNTDKNSKIEVAAFDITGRKVFTEKSVISGNFNTTVNLSHLPKGIYAVQVRSAEGVISKNVMVH